MKKPYGLKVRVQEKFQQKSLHSLRRGGAAHFFRVTGNLSATLERGRWLSVSSGRIDITEGLSILARRKIRPATTTALRMAAEALQSVDVLESVASDDGMCLKQGRLQRRCGNGCQDVVIVNALGMPPLTTRGVRGKGSSDARATRSAVQ